MRLILAAALLLVVAPAWAQETPLSSILDRAVEQVIRPNVGDFYKQADGLAQAMEKLCTEPSEAALDEARGRFETVVVAFGRIELIRIGPLMENNRSERLLFWPDRRGIGLRQVQAILAEEDQTALSAEGLAGKSVAVQGFGALEFVLFGTDSDVLADAGGAFRCGYGQAIAQSAATIGGELEAGWTDPEGIASRLMAPQADFADYRTDTEAVEALVGILSHGIEAVRDVKLKPFLATDDAAAKPRSALFWRSGLTMPMMRANVEGLEALFRLSGVGTAAPGSDVGIGNSIDFEFRNAFRALDLVSAPVEEAVSDPKQVQALNYLVLVTGSLQAMIGEQLSTALALSVGFSSLDGD